MRNLFSKKDAIEHNMRVIRHSSTKQYLIFIALCVVACAVFFTSGWWVPLLQNDTIAVSAIGTTQSISATEKLTLRHWIYDQGNGVMEVCLDTNAYDDIAERLSVSASCRRGEKNTPVTAELVGCWEQKLFFTLSDLPTSYDVITLTIHNEVEATDTAYAYFSCNGSVQIVDEIGRKNVTDYRVYAIDLCLEDIQAQEKTCDNDVLEAQAEYRRLADEINTLEAQKPYQTTSEQKATTAQQTSLENEQRSLLQSIMNTTTLRSELQEKTEVLNKKRAAILAGEF